MILIPRSFSGYLVHFWEPLKEGAPEEAKKAYEEYMNGWLWEEIKRRHPEMKNPVFHANGEIVDDPSAHFERKTKPGVRTV